MNNLYFWRLLHSQCRLIKKYKDNFYDITIIYTGRDEKKNLFWRAVHYDDIYNFVLEMLKHNKVFLKHPEWFKIDVYQSVEYDSEILINIKQFCWEERSDENEEA